MSSLRKLFIVASFALALPSVASAADLPEYIPEPYVAPQGGWYLRGDIGFKIYADPSARTTYNNIGDFSNEGMDNTALVGGGIGYYFNDWFRADVTADYEFKSGFDGHAPCGGCGAIGYSVETADIDAWTFMVNAYADLGTWQGFTPYVGAGIGTSYVSASGVRGHTATGVPVSYDSHGRWNLAWALMAGASYEISPNMMIDAGYQFRSLGKAKSGRISGTQSRIEYDDIYAHELRLGLRYNFN
ncbi:opacity protein-like surface antigen [Breoghania corrubedonensis]|uniref:Opacity protein-like surface antigen n=1 Tax=Breoghania corrubedonensis TaxID=665038 RepID=A0A2T5V7I0_9HYPH|nr:outer membrane protein [Breoghania corrubedonensis]PTW59691.1 opacity protein-like surface antigen [Breoghania corrubedonensis]